MYRQARIPGCPILSSPTGKGGFVPLQPATLTSAQICPPERSRRTCGCLHPSATQAGFKIKHHQPHRKGRVRTPHQSVLLSEAEGPAVVFAPPPPRLVSTPSAASRAGPLSAPPFSPLKPQPSKPPRLPLRNQVKGLKVLVAVVVVTGKVDIRANPSPFNHLRPRPDLENSPPKIAHLGKPGRHPKIRPPISNFSTPPRPPT